MRQRDNLFSLLQDVLTFPLSSAVGLLSDHLSPPFLARSPARPSFLRLTIKTTNPISLCNRWLRVPAGLKTREFALLRVPAWAQCCLAENMSDGEEERKKPRVLQMVRAEGSDKSSVTFVLHNEDHTLGNSLRYMIMKDPEVTFCGYSITHPSESKINFRIQTKDGVPAVDTFQKGLEELMGVCEHVLNTFEARIEEYKVQKDVDME